MNARQGIVLLWLVFASLCASAQGGEAPAKEAPKGDNKIRLATVDTGSGNGLALALEFDLKFSRSLASRGSTTSGSGTISKDDVSGVYSQGSFNVAARGQITGSKLKNPNKMIELNVDYMQEFSTRPAFFLLGGKLAYETDQSGDNKQAVYSLVGSTSKRGMLTNGDFGSIILAYGVVDPKADEERAKVLATLESYKRWNAEVSYTYNVNRSRLSSIDFNYRLYKEASAPAAVRAAGLDDHHLGLVRLNFDLAGTDGLFLQYSKGTLPFDARSERAVKVGLTYKLN